jgi:putative transposase
MRAASRAFALTEPTSVSHAQPACRWRAELLRGRVLDFPRRKHPAHPLPVEQGNRRVIVFLTVCVRNRRRLLATPEAHVAIVESWQRSTHWLVGRYVIMPDHLHLFCAPGTLPMQPLNAWVRYWQNLFTRAWPQPNEKPIWQKEFWDRQLRSGDSYNQKWDYVLNNPVRHGLCATPTDWSYQGELNVLPWHQV